MLSTYTAITHCSRCKRVLSDPDSVQRGMGPECASRSWSPESGLCKRDKFSDEFDGSIPFERAFVMKRHRSTDPSEKGIVVTNVSHLVVQHSPDGFEFGYGGSGPADLALNACQLYLNMTGYEGKIMKCYDGKCWSLAFALHQDFKSQFITGAPREGRIIPFKQIDAWFQTHITSGLLEQYRNSTEE